jgi:hypothetical protein
MPIPANLNDADPEDAGLDEDVPDSRFDMPGVDEPAAVEAGIVLQGLDAERLLAGLGLAALADDPALVTLAVDRIRHGAHGALTTDHLFALGARCWLDARDALTAVSGSAPLTGSPRLAWAQAARVVRVALEGDAPNTGPNVACAAYLTACWIRRDELDALASKTSAAV